MNDAVFFSKFHYYVRYKTLILGNNVGGNRWSHVSMKTIFRFIGIGVLFTIVYSCVYGK